MKLTGLHVLLTYKCIYECDHCFVWGSPKQSGVFSLDRLDVVLDQAVQLGSIRQIYFEGGETFVYYPILIAAVRRAARHFNTAIVTNGYWATSIEEAFSWLSRLAGAGLQRVDFSLDEDHGVGLGVATHPGVIAAHELGLETRPLRVTTWRGGDEPNGDTPGAKPLSGRPAGTDAAADLPRHPWISFTYCPYENLVSPRRLQVDPFGNLHLCQGLVIGNLFESPLPELVAGYVPENHPIVGPLAVGGPAELVRRYRLEPELAYVDACHLCYSSRDVLRARFPPQLRPSQVCGADVAVSRRDPGAIPG
jgi:hypothetical protein